MPVCSLLAILLYRSHGSTVDPTRKALHEFDI